MDFGEKMNSSSMLRGTAKICFCILLMLVFFVERSAFAQGGDYEIGKGDELLITVWGYTEFTGPTTVKDDGTVSLALLGDVPAAGLTKDAFVASLRSRLREYVQGDARVTVSVVSSAGQRVTILGAVTRPDNYAVSDNLSLLEIISKAGGYLPDASLDRIRIFRKNERLRSTEVDLEYYMKRADIENMPTVHPGDVVFVPRQENFIKEVGGFFRDLAFIFALFRLSEGAR
jgi:polysaccharide biosynthesis/export protein